MPSCTCCTFVRPTEPMSMADTSRQIGEVVTTIPTIGFNVEYFFLLSSTTTPTDCALQIRELRQPQFQRLGMLSSRLYIYYTPLNHTPTANPGNTRTWAAKPPSAPTGAATTPTPQRSSSWSTQPTLSVSRSQRTSSPQCSTRTSCVKLRSSSLRTSRISPAHREQARYRKP
jgi:hypothetical protein